MSEQKPRVWTCFAVWVAALWALGAAGAWMIVPVLLSFDASAEASFEDHLAACLTQPAFMLALMVAAQLALLIPLGLAARASSVPWRTRLTAGWGRTPRKWLPLYCLASLGAGTLGGLVVNLEDSTYAQDLARAVEQGSLPVVLGFVVLGSVLPGIIEELLFRLHPEPAAPAMARVGGHRREQRLVCLVPHGPHRGAAPGHLAGRAWRTGGVRLGVVCRIFTNRWPSAPWRWSPTSPGFLPGSVLAQTVAVGFLVAGVVLYAKGAVEARPRSGCGLRAGARPASRRALPHPLRPAATAGGRSASYGTSSYSSPSSPPDQESGDSGIAQASPSPLASIVGT